MKLWDDVTEQQKEEENEKKRRLLEQQQDNDQPNKKKSYRLGPEKWRLRAIRHTVGRSIYLQQHAEAGPNTNNPATSFVPTGEPLGFPLHQTPVHNTLLYWCTTICWVVGDDRHRRFPLSFQDKLFYQPDGLDCRLLLQAPSFAYQHFLSKWYS